MIKIGKLFLNVEQLFFISHYISYRLVYPVNGHGVYI